MVRGVMIPLATRNKDTKPLLISVLMAITTLFAPTGAYYWGAGGSSTEGKQILVMIHAMIWAIMPRYAFNSGFQILTNEILAMGVFLNIFNIIFAVQVIRYCSGNTTRVKLILSGLATLIIPVFTLLTAIPMILETESIAYVGPIPIQLVVGLVIARIKGKPPVSEPFDEEEQGEWWTENEPSTQ